MRTFQFRLDISASVCERYYRGQAQHVVARCTDGTSVQFPALLMKRFIASNGVHGLFVLTCDDEGKHASLERV